MVDALESTMESTYGEVIFNSSIGSHEPCFSLNTVSVQFTHATNIMCCYWQIIFAHSVFRSLPIYQTGSPPEQKMTRWPGSTPSWVRSGTWLEQEQEELEMEQEQEKVELEMEQEQEGT
jgi:hypothetical protein